MPITLSRTTKEKASRRQAGGVAVLLRRIPSIDRLLLEPALQDLARRFPRDSLVAAVRREIQSLRTRIRTGRLPEPEFDEAMAGLPSKLEAVLERRFSPSLQKVINATGVVLHTNLGRAPLSLAAIERLREVAAGYSNLEFDILKNARGNRDVHAENLLKALLHCEGALIVNNCAAAVLLTLNTLAEGGEAIVSRGELVEIGGSFRIPEIMAKSGARLREVGTTNRTRISDYQRAINPSTRIILRVHRSNFRMVGFAEQPALEEIVRLARKRRLPVMEDLGSGCLVDLSPAGIPGEPTVSASLRSGPDVITFSGDKLLGGPQAGIILGRRKLLAQLRSNPLYRALRVDKLTLAALEATLLSYLRGEECHSIPALKMIFRTREQLEERTKALIQRVQQAAGTIGALSLGLVAGPSLIGGGSTPGQEIPTCLLAVTSKSCSARAVEAHLRSWRPPILTRVDGNRILLDLRTVEEDEEKEIVQSLISLSQAGKKNS